MSYKLVNTSATERLAQGDTLRITLSKSGLINASQFASHVNGIYEQLIGTKVSPVSSDPAIADGQPAVIDVRLLQSMVVADFAAMLDSIVGLWVSVSQIEKLNAAAAAVADTNEGAASRQTVSDTQAKANDTSGIFGSIGNFFAEAKHMVIILAVIVVVIAIVMYHKEISAAVKKVPHWDK